MSSALRRWIAGGGTVGLLIVGVQVLGTTSASAHSNNVAGQAQCQSNGSYTVTWTITNDYDLSETATVNSFTPSGSSLSANSVDLAASSQGGHSATISQTGIPGNATSASLEMQGHWSDKYSQADHGSVSLGGTCKVQHTPTAPTGLPGKCDASFNQVQPTITIPSDPGVTYKIDGTARSAGTYAVDPGKHTVDASSATLTLLPPTSWNFDLAAPPGDCNTTVTPEKPNVTQSVCDNSTHKPTNPTLNLASTLGITYSVDKSAPYTAGETVKVTAKASDGYEFKNDPGSPWTFVDKKTETLTLTFDDAPDCIVNTTPVTPDVQQSVCNGHVPTDPTLTFKNTPGIDYTADPSSGWKPGDSVTVTATLQDGYRFPASLPSGWSLSGKDAVTTVKFDAAPDCRGTATPENPDVTQSVCNGHNPSDPTLTFPKSEGIDYSVDPSSGWKPGDTVTVTATLQGGYKFVSPLPNGWTAATATTATKEITFSAAPDCRSIIKPDAPSLTEEQCPVTGTTPIAPTLTLPITVGIDYSVDKQPPYAGGDVVTVIATTQKDYKFDTTLPSGWVRESDTVAKYTVTFAPAFTCGVPSNPTLTQSQCPAGSTTPSAPTLTFPTTADVVYTASPAGPYQGGDAVTVTATAQSGHQFDTTAPSGWTFVNATTETYKVTFDASPSCSLPVTPTFSDDQCVGHSPSSATYTIPSTTGVDYYVNKVLTAAGKYTATDGSTIKVVAKPQTGYTLVGTSSWKHSFPATPNCSNVKSITVARAVFHNDECVHGSPRGATYTVPKTTGVSYTVNGKKVSGGTYRAVGGSTVTVVATALPGFTLKGRKSWTHTFAQTPKCHHVASKHVHKVPPAPLANTGVPTARILTVGIGLLLAGAGCVFLSNRRRRTNG
ncbi:MAG TPA: hypothetical protein VGH30_03725 [Jatrophihabitantaceae bacterium]